MSLSDNNQADVVAALNSKSSNPYFKQMVSQIYPIEPQLNKANTFDTEALFSNMDLSITNGIVFELVDCSFLDECF